MKRQQRPVNLNLFTIHFPIPAIVSILHRITGVVLFLIIPLMLWGFYLSLSSPHDYDAMQQFMASAWMKFFIWILLSAFIYHLIAGIRHLLMDLGIAEELKSGKFSAKLTIIFSIILSILAGIWLW